MLCITRTISSCHCSVHSNTRAHTLTHSCIRISTRSYTFVLHNTLTSGLFFFLSLSLSLPLSHFSTHICTRSFSQALTLTYSWKCNPTLILSLSHFLTLSLSHSLTLKRTKTSLLSEHFRISKFKLFSGSNIRNKNEKKKNFWAFFVGHFKWRFVCL